MIRRLVGGALFVGLLFATYACGENVPPKGSHDEVKPAPIASTSSIQSSSAVVVAPPSASPSQSPSDNSESSSTPSDYSLDIAMNDANAKYVFNPADITVNVGETVTLKLTSEDCLKFKIIDEKINELPGGAHRFPTEQALIVKEKIFEATGEEKTAFRFTTDASGEIIEVNELQANLVNSLQ